MTKKKIIGPMLFAFLAAFILYRPPAFLTVQEVVVVTSPLKHLNETDLIRLSGVKRGDNLFTLRLGEIRSRIRRFPWVREVRLSKRFPGRLLIWVEEERPLALLQMEEEKGLYLVNGDGEIFKKATTGDPKDLPVIDGLSRENLVSHLKILAKLLKNFESSLKFRSVGVSEIHWQGSKGVALFTREPCVRIELGNEGWEEKLSRLEAAWDTIRSTTRKPKVVDLNFARRIIVKRETGSRGSNTLKKEVIQDG